MADADATPETVESIVADARAKTTLVDLFMNKGDIETSKVLPTKKVPVFRDLDAVEEYQRHSAAANALEEMIAALPSVRSAEGKTVAAKQTRANYAEALELAAQKRDEAKEQMLSTALSFHLRAYPNVALKVAKREGKALFVDPQTGDYREGYGDAEYQDWLELRMFGEAVQKVVRSDGTEVDFGVPRKELGEMLSNSEQMHPATWQNLMDEYRALVYRASISRAGVLDPGF